MDIDTILNQMESIRQDVSNVVEEIEGLDNITLDNALGELNDVEYEVNNVMENLITLQDELVRVENIISDLSY